MLIPYQRLTSSLLLILLQVYLVDVSEWVRSHDLLGAMENWGLVTYRERVLLVDPVNTSQGTKQYVALVVGEYYLIW